METWPYFFIIFFAVETQVFIGPIVKGVKLIMIALKVAGLIVGVWAGVKLSAIAIAWMKEGFEKLKPPKNNW